MNCLVASSLLLVLSASLGAQRTVEGTVSPWRQLWLRPSISGQVRMLSVDVGDRVERDQVLMEFDAPELRFAADTAATALELAEIAVRHAELERDLLRSEIASHVESAQGLKKRIESASKRAAAAETRVQGVESLFEAGRASTAELQEARAELARMREHFLELELDHARARRRARHAELVSERAALDVRAAKVRLQAARVELERARHALAGTRLRAPYAGTIDSVSCGVGDFVTARESKLLKLVDTSRARIAISLKDKEGGLSLQNGMKVEVLPYEGDAEAGSMGKLQRRMRKSYWASAEVVLPNEDQRWIMASRVKVRLPFE